MELKKDHLSLTYRSFLFRNDRIKAMSFLKKGIWLYFFLLIFEGALRKWLFPSLSVFLLVIRDPLALALLFIAWNNRIFRMNTILLSMMLISFISLFVAIFIGHGNLIVALFGIRILLIQFPLIFVIGNVLDRSDIIQMGKIILQLSVPMSILIVLQFYLPQTHVVNLGLGGVVDEIGFQGALGHFRPSGTFSFVTGTSLFYGLSAAYCLFFWLVQKGINRPLLIISSIAILITIPFSISRTLFFEVIIVFLFAFFTTIYNKQYRDRYFIITASLIIGFLIFYFVPFIKESITTFIARFSDASDTEGGLKGTLGTRFIGGLISAFKDAIDVPFWGYGIGMGTNVGSQLLAGNRGFLLHEDEWGRIIDELGLLIGTYLIFIRVKMGIIILITSYRRLKFNDILPWMLTSTFFLQIIQGNWAQSTSLGFCVLMAGLVYATIKKPVQILDKI